MSNSTTYELRDEDNLESTLGTAEVVPMAEGDLLVSLRHAGAHPDDEAVIITMAALADGRIRVRLQSREQDIAEIHVGTDGVTLTR